MRELWREPPDDHSFQKLEDWFDGLKRAEKTDFYSANLKKARKGYEELAALTQDIKLLHGDLHHENILSAGREPLLAIDPKGIVGDFGYETSTFLINHARWLAGESDLKEKLENSIRLFSTELGIEPRVISGWAFAQSVLSAWWTFEENCDNWKAELVWAGIWEELNF